MMNIKVAYDENAYEIKKAHDTDAGFDIRTPYSFVLSANGYGSIDTGVHIEIPKGYVGFLKSKSGLNVNHSVVGEGVIDSGYTGSIVVKLYNNSNYDYEFEEGDKIIQLVILPIPEITLNKVELSEFDKSERGEQGFGSSGK